MMQDLISLCEVPFLEWSSCLCTHNDVLVGESGICTVFTTNGNGISNTSFGLILLTCFCLHRLK